MAEKKYFSINSGPLSILQLEGQLLQLTRQDRDREILLIMAEWAMEKAELVPILQWTEQSFRDSEMRATGKAFEMYQLQPR